MIRKIKNIIYWIILRITRIRTSLVYGRYFVDEMTDEIWDRLYFSPTGVFVSVTAYLNREASIKRAENYFGRQKIGKYIFLLQDGVGSIMTNKRLLRKNKPLTKKGLFKILIPTFEPGGDFGSYYEQENQKIKEERAKIKREYLVKNGCKLHPLPTNNDYWVEYPKKKK